MTHKRATIIAALAGALLATAPAHAQARLDMPTLATTWLQAPGLSPVACRQKASAAFADLGYVRVVESEGDTVFAQHPIQPIIVGVRCDLFGVVFITLSQPRISAKSDTAELAMIAAAVSAASPGKALPMTPQAIASPRSPRRE